MEKFLSALHALSELVPLPVFTTIGGFIEEVVAPIPSPLVMTSAGSIALEQGQTAFYIVIISLFAAIGKTIGAIIIYYFADKAEDVVLSRFGKFLGITHREVESIGKRFNKTWKDDVILFLLRAIPVFPGAPVAAVAGLIKINMRTYVQSTFLGVWVRSMIFAYIGYYGLSQLNEFVASAEDVGKILFFLAVGVTGIIIFQKKRDHIQEVLLKRLKSN